MIRAGQGHLISGRAAVALCGESALALGRILEVVL